MAKQVINLGTTTNDGTGDTLRTGAQKINDNFTELYSVVGNAVPTKTSELVNDANFITATSLKWNSILNKPTIPSNTNELVNGANFITDSSLTWNNISGKPTIPSNTNELVNGANFITASSLTWNSISGKPTIPTDLTDLDIVDGTAGQVLTTTGNGTFTFATVSSNLPDQTDNFGRILTTSGTEPVWSNLISIVTSGSTLAVAFGRDIKLKDYTDTTRNTFLTASADGSLMYNNTAYRTNFQVKKDSEWMNLSLNTPYERTGLTQTGLDNELYHEALSENVFRASGQTANYMWSGSSPNWFRWNPTKIQSAVLDLMVEEIGSVIIIDSKIIGTNFIPGTNFNSGLYNSLADIVANMTMTDNNGTGAVANNTVITTIQNSVRTASISETTLTVTGYVSGGGPITVGSVVTGPDVLPGTHVTAIVSGSGGNGTYTINNSQTVTSSNLINFTNYVVNNSQTTVLFNARLAGTYNTFVGSATLSTVLNNSGTDYSVKVTGTLTPTKPSPFNIDLNYTSTSTSFGGSYPYVEFPATFTITPSSDDSRIMVTKWAGIFTLPSHNLFLIGTAAY